VQHTLLTNPTTPPIAQAASRASDFLCKAGLVGQSFSEVDLERQQRCRPVASLRPRRYGVGDREVDEFPGGFFVGEVPLGLDRFAELPVERFDRVGIPYERRRMPAVTFDRFDAWWRPGW
jgi:hypothetical protein